MGSYHLCQYSTFLELKGITKAFPGVLALDGVSFSAKRGAVGVDSCWIHRAKQVFESEDGKALLKKWGLDSNTYVGIGFCILGYAEGTRPKPAARKEGYIIKVK
ncbi:hypothetical protein AGMMS49940_00690 [Spirochaetia bacterium]|nr:hypothetical protein AGMMS49940_00690 [Spirochaetia bacterium]